MYKRCLYLILFFTPLLSNGQEVENGESKVLLRKDYSVGINFNTSGWGLAFDYGWQKNFKYKQTLGFTCTNIRHEKEHKIYGSLSNNRKPFFLGKLESLVSFRPHYGGKLVLFKAKRENGIEICAKWSLGPSIALVKPVYLKIETISSPSIDTRYDPTVHNLSNIAARSSWFKGLGESTMRLGAFGKFGFDFNFSALKNGISGGEFGVMLDYFPGKEIEIMYNNDNYSFFSVLYLQFNIGQKLY